MDVRNAIASPIRRKNKNVVTMPSTDYPREFESQEQATRPSDTSIIYGFRRAAATDEILEEIQELLEASRFELRMMDETDSGKEPVKLIIPTKSGKE